MTRFTVILPIVDNDGVANDSREIMREALRTRGIDGWTEYQTVGSWNGRLEPGTLWEFYRATNHPGAFAHTLGVIARHVLPLQEAIQVTFEPLTTTLIEA